MNSHEREILCGRKNDPPPMVLGKDKGQRAENKNVVTTDPITVSHIAGYFKKPIANIPLRRQEVAYG